MGQAELGKDSRRRLPASAQVPRCSGALCHWLDKVTGELLLQLLLCGRPRRDGRPHHLPEVYERYALAIFQDRVALPAWSAGRPVEHPEWQTRELGVDELLDWYEEQLDLKRLFDDHVDVIASWRRTQEAEPTARYVLVWHIMALLATRHRGRILTYGRSQYEFGLPDHERRAAEALGCAAATETVHFCHGLAFCNDARVLLPTARQVDLWPLFLQKRSAQEALEHVLQSTLSS